MNRIQALFQEKKKRILSVYFTAGFPQPLDTVPLLRSLERYGVDMVEIGMPYSDPLADGPTIQKSNSIALANQMSIPRLFEQLNGFRKEIKIPVILMGYLNPVLQFGFENFSKMAAEAGIDGLILPDLPPFEYKKEYKSTVDKYGLNFIFLITPETPDKRIRLLDRLSGGFVYAVSSSSTTGSSTDPSRTEPWLKRLEKMRLQNPVMVGFGIRDKEGFDLACRYAQGVVVGSAYIQALMGPESPDAATRGFISSLLG